MSDLGVQRQNSSDQNEAVIPGVAHLLLSTNNRSRVTSTIHEREGENEKTSSKPVTSPQASTPGTPQTGAFFFPGSRNTQEDSEPRVGASTTSGAQTRPSFRIGSPNEASTQEDESNGEPQGQQHRSRERPCLEQRTEVDEEEQLLEGSHLGLRSLLPRREIRQQVHIIEHVYNGRCVLGVSIS